MLQSIVACLLFSSASCLRLGHGHEHAPDHHHRHHVTDDTRQECEGRPQEWIQEGGVRRLRGPVFFFHVNHHAGRALASMAANAGGYHTRTFTRWSDVEAVRDGKPIQSAWYQVTAGYDMFQDKSWTDLEDTFADHTLDDLVCHGPHTLRIFASSARHPVENLLTHEAYAQGSVQEYGLMRSCESDNIALRVFAGKVCKSRDAEHCEELTRDDLEIAKARARKMDVIVVLHHFPATIQLACARLGWAGCTNLAQRPETYASEIVDQLDEESWNQLFKRNALGIEFYEYMKQLSFEMLKEEGLDVPTKHQQEQALQVLKSLQDVKAMAIPYSQRRDSGTSASARWQCG